MGAWVGRVNCFYISWKRSFHSPVELDLTPTWPILWSSDRVTAPQPATHLTFFEPTHLPFGQSEQSEMKQLLFFFIISLQFLLDRKNNQTGLNTDIISNKIFRPCNFGTVVALFSFLSFPTCHNWLPAELPPVLIRGGRGRHLCFKTCFHKKLYWLRLSKASNARAGRDLLFKAGPRYELKIWLHARLTASFDGFRISLC